MSLDTSRVAQEQMRNKAEEAAKVASTVGELKADLAVAIDAIEALKTVVIGLDERLKKLEPAKDAKASKKGSNGK